MAASIRSTVIYFRFGRFVWIQSVVLKGVNTLGWFLSCRIYKRLTYCGRPNFGGQLKAKRTTVVDQ